MKKPLRVLFPFVGDTVGGSHISTLELISALNKFPIEPIIVIHQDGQLKQWLNDKNVDYQVISIPYYEKGLGIVKNLFRIATGFFSARKLMLKEAIDIVHCNDNRTFYTWSLWCKFSGLPVICHKRYKWSAKCFRDRISLFLMDGLIFISKYTANYASQIHVPHRIIYNPVAIKEHDNVECAIKLKKELHLTDSTFVVGCFGNAQAFKRPDTFTHVASLFASQSHKPITLLWVGDDRDGMLSSLLSSAGTPCRAKHLGFRSNPLSLMAGCDVLLAPSSREAFGRTLVEAMSLGVPVVASNNYGHIEIIEHEKNGLLFSVGDAQACADSVMRVLNDHDLRKRMIASGYETAKKFSPSFHAEKVYDFYLDILNLKHSRSS